MSDEDDGKVVPIGTKKPKEGRLASANPRVSAALHALNILSLDELQEVLDQMPTIVDDVAARNGLPKK